jgi:hypothetical protein
MSTQTDVAAIERKVLRETQQDGLMELVMGLCLAAFATRMLHPVFIVTFVIGPLAFRPVLTALRRRYTYPRIGYFNLVDDNPKETLAGIGMVFLILFAVLTIGFLIFGDVRDFGLWLKWLPVFPGTLFAVMFCSLGRKSGLWRHHGLAAVSGIGGLAISMLRFDPAENGLFVYCLVMGGVLIGSGLLTFLQFLRRYPKPPAEVSDVNR